QSTMQLVDVRARQHTLTGQRAATQNQIAALVGDFASDIRIAEAPHVIKLPAIMTSQPSELLQRRPDIAAAQRRVMAANSRIGVAKAAFYPRIDPGLATGVPIISA